MSDYGWGLYEPIKPENLPFAQEMCDRLMADLRGEDERERREEDDRLHQLRKGA